MAKSEWYGFLLLALLIGVAYFVGLATDINAFSAGLVRVAYAFSGRNAQGNFAGYPTGATQAQNF